MLIADLGYWKVIGKFLSERVIISVVIDFKIAFVPIGSQIIVEVRLNGITKVEIG